MRAFVVVVAVSCSSAATPPEQHPHPPTAVDAAVAAQAVTPADCDQLVAHVVALQAARRGSAATDEVQTSVRSEIHRDCAGMSVAALRCGLAATAVEQLETCDDVP